jgi:predicted PurR-regulated permease PerM
VLVISLLIAGVFGTIWFLRSENGYPPIVFEKIAAAVEHGRDSLPGWLADWLPSNSDDLRDALESGLREHVRELELAGMGAGRLLAEILVGMVIGAMIAVRSVAPPGRQKSLARALLARLERFGDSFRNVVFAQLRITAINAALTAIYLLVVLPTFGVHLPLTKTLIAVTFFAGLLPIIGNLLSNSLIVMVSLSVSFSVAVASLIFLIVIHKLEYFLNAHIVGTKINARSWELLVAMLAMEAAFGLAGLIAAPIYYAYLKRELVEQGWV